MVSKAKRKAIIAKVVAAAQAVWHVPGVESFASGSH